MEELLKKLENAETVDEINAVKGEIEQHKAHEAAIAEKAALLENLKGNESEVKADKTCKTLGEWAVKHLDLSAIRSGASKSAGTDYGFKAYTDPQTSQQMLQTSQIVTDVTSMRELAIRSLFGTETISGNALKYFVLGAKEDNSAPSPKGVSEAAAKPQFHIVESSATVTLQKIAGWFYETDELIEDNAFLKSALENRGLFELDSAIESYLLTTLLGTSGIGTATYTHGSAVGADDVFKAIMTVKTASNLNADAIIMHPTDYQAIRLAKDGGSTGQYYGGGCFYGPYANGQLAQQPGLWGLNTVVTSSITQGTVLVGAFGQGASVITKAGEGARLEVVTGDHDDRIYNRVTVIVEERLGLAVRVPSAFVKLTEAAS